MNSRLLDIIRYKTGGVQTEFAALMGWTPQYLAKLLRGDNFGITPVIALVETLPEINARWLLTGQGEMLEPGKYADLRRTMVDSLFAVLDMGKYIPVMSPEELHAYEQTLQGRRQAIFSPEKIENWQRRLQEREEERNARIDSAMRESVLACKPKKTKK